MSDETTVDETQEDIGQIETDGDTIGDDLDVGDLDDLVAAMSEEND